jgi:hypothetical protein
VLWAWLPLEPAALLAVIACFAKRFETDGAKATDNLKQIGIVTGLRCMDSRFNIASASGQFHYNGILAAFREPTDVAEYVMHDFHLLSVVIVAHLVSTVYLALLTLRRSRQNLGNSDKHGLF